MECRFSGANHLVFYSDKVQETDYPVNHTLSGASNSDVSGGEKPPMPHQAIQQAVKEAKENSVRKISNFTYEEFTHLEVQLFLNQNVPSSRFWDDINNEIYKTYVSKLPLKKKDTARLLSDYYEENPELPKSAFIVRMSNQNPSDLVICFNENNKHKEVKLIKTKNNQWMRTDTSFQSPTLISVIESFSQVRILHWLCVK